MVFLSDGGTGLMPLMSASTVSVETQASCVLWLQSIFDGLAETVPLTGATTTVALATPALKRCANAASLPGTQSPVVQDEPRAQGLVFSFPFEISTITRWSAATVIRPDHSSLPYRVTVTWCVPGGTTNSWRQNKLSLLNSSTWPTKYRGFLPFRRTAAAVSPFSLPTSIWMRPRGPGTASPTGSLFMSTVTLLFQSNQTSCSSTFLAVRFPQGQPSRAKLWHLPLGKKF